LAYPVLNTTRVVATTANNVPDLIAARPYSFGFWSYYAVLQKRVTQAASLVNTAGRYSTLNNQQLINRSSVQPLTDIPSPPELWHPAKRQSPRP
jgi:hypothetical protein